MLFPWLNQRTHWASLAKWGYFLAANSSTKFPILLQKWSILTKQAGEVGAESSPHSSRALAQYDSWCLEEVGFSACWLTYHSSGFSSFWKKCNWFLIVSTTACLDSIWKIEPRTFSNTLVTVKARLEIVLVAPLAFHFTGFKNWAFFNKLTSKGNFCCRRKTETWNWKKFKHPFLNFF